MNTNDIESRIRKVLAAEAQLVGDAAALQLDDDLFAQGMSSRASVSVMLALESEFDVEFPDALLRRDVFESIRSISTAISSLL